jgi:CRP/FNR family cyclic AMP-dependent transcriptional regulator
MKVTVEGNYISQVPLFEGLDEEQQRSLRAKMGQTTLRRGEILFEEGEQGNRLYIITEGKVKLGHTSLDGRENLLAVLGPGEIIGELTLFDPGPRSTTATAVSPVTLLHLDHSDLSVILDTNPTMAKHMLRALARRLRRTNESLADLVFSDVPGRVAKALLDLADRFGTPTDEGVHVPHDLTQEELAQLVGASRETVNKSLADFVSRGWIQLEGRAVTLLDLDRLARRAR